VLFAAVLVHGVLTVLIGRRDAVSPAGAPDPPSDRPPAAPGVDGPPAGEASAGVSLVLVVVGVGLLVAGATVLVDGGLPVPAAAVALDIPVMLAAVVALLSIAFTGFAVARWEGGLFLILYLAYTGYVLLAATEHDALEGFSSVMVSFVLPLIVMTLVAVSAHELGRRRERRGLGGPAGAP
jgi:hypothetical protein